MAGRVVRHARPPVGAHGDSTKPVTSTPPDSVVSSCPCPLTVNGEVVTRNVSVRTCIPGPKSTPDSPPRPPPARCHPSTVRNGCNWEPALIFKVYEHERAHASRSTQRCDELLLASAKGSRFWCHQQLINCTIRFRGCAQRGARTRQGRVRAESCSLNSAAVPCSVKCSAVRDAVVILRDTCMSQHRRQCQGRAHHLPIDRFQTSSRCGQRQRRGPHCTTRTQG